MRIASALGQIGLLLAALIGGDLLRSSAPAAAERAPSSGVVTSGATPRAWIPRIGTLRPSEPIEAVEPESRAASARSAEAQADSLERAFRHQQSLLRRYPSRSRPHLALGEIYYRIGNDYAARHHLEQFLERGPTGTDSLRAARLRARCLIRLGRTFEAAVAMTQLAQRADAPFGVHHDLSLLLARDGRPAEALMAEMRAIEASGGEPDFVREATAQWKELGRIDQCLELGELIVRDARARAEDHFQTGFMAHRLGRVDEAIDRYESALARDPDHAEAHYNLALLRESRGETEPAIHHWREVVRLRPAYDATYFQLGTLLLDLDRRDEAIGLLESYIRQGTDFQAIVEAAGILNSLGVPPTHWRALLDARTEQLVAEGRKRWEESARAAAADSAAPAPAAP